MSLGQQFTPPVSVVQPAGQYYQPIPTAPYVPMPPTPPPFAAQQFRPQPWSPPAPSPTVMQVPVIRAPMPAAPPAMQQQMSNVPWSPIHFPIPQGLPYSALGYYGYYPDQVWGALAAVPPVWRPQQPGETFGARAFKNLFLVLMEKAFEQGMLTTRQMFLPPEPPHAAQTVVDVTPQK